MPRNNKKRKLTYYGDDWVRYMKQPKFSFPPKQDVPPPQETQESTLEECISIILRCWNTINYQEDFADAWNSLDNTPFNIQQWNKFCKSKKSWGISPPGMNRTSVQWHNTKQKPTSVFCVEKTNRFAQRVILEKPRTPVRFWHRRVRIR